VNLIGEHVDYNGYPVLPLAVPQAVRLAAAPRGDTAVRLHNAAEAAFGDRSFDVAETIPPSEIGDWGNYAKAAVESLTRLAIEQGRPAGTLHGMDCLVHSDLPPASGLSSSTALVVAVGLAFAAVNRLPLEPHAMAERMAEAEHYVGTQGGGMDQAACLLARRGYVLKVEFHPLRAAHLPFPPGHCIIAAHSTVQARKTAEQRLAYNRRVIECRVGAHLLARALGVRASGAAPARRLSDLAPLVADAEEELPRRLHALVDGREGLAPADAADALGMDPARFAQTFLRMSDGRILSVPADGLKVLSRCRHVFSEAARTRRAERCLETGDMPALGRLMDQSHASCAADMEVSCPELDQLVGIMRNAGALGARLTGAGLGGFAVALAPVGAADDILRALRRDFYARRPPAPDGALFVCRPAQGAVEEPF